MAPPLASGPSPGRDGSVEAPKPTNGSRDRYTASLHEKLAGTVLSFFTDHETVTCWPTTADPGAVNFGTVIPTGS